MTTSNPYEELYRTRVGKVSPAFAMKEAEEMTVQMSLIYNAFGNALKDLVGLLSILYSSRQQTSISVDKDVKKLQPTVQKTKQAPRNTHKIKNTHNFGNKQSGSGNQMNVKQPDFNKYMMSFNQKAPKNYPTLNEKIDSKESQNSKSLKTERMIQPVQRIEVVRGKKQREALNGYSCVMCSEFYKALGEDYLDSSGRNKLCNDCSRHRSNLPPTNFNCDFSQEFGFDD